jgi:hypothetical protein
MPRLRVGTFPLLAAAACLVLGLDGMRRRRAYCLEHAEIHRDRLIYVMGGHFVVRLADNAITTRRGHPRFIYYPGDGLRQPTAAERGAADDDMAGRSLHYAWHLEWARRFERAASRPWETAPIDPPEPDHLWNVADCHFML